MLSRTIAMTVGLLAVTAAGASANEFRMVTDRAEFVSLVDGRALTRLGIRLQVSPQGGIVGRAFGRNVTGAWQWEGTYFCRDMAYGSTEIGYNCQAVLVNGNTVRFISDQGQGEYADLRLR